MANSQNVIHVLSPAAILICYLGCSLWETIKTGKDEDAKQEPVESSTPSDTLNSSVVETARALTRPQVLQRGLQIFFCSMIGLLYIGEAIALLTFDDPKQTPGTADPNVVFALFSSLLWIVLLLNLLDVGAALKGNNFAFSWSLAAVFEVILFGSGFAPSSKYSGPIRTTQITLQSTRIFALSTLVASEFLDRLFRPGVEVATDEEIAPLLVGGSNKADQKKHAEDRDKATDMDLRRISKNWWLYVRGFKLFLPILRPQTVQQYLCVLGVGICLLIERAMNVATPVTLGAIVTALSHFGDSPQIPWVPISLYIVLKILESSAGVGLLRDLLWQPVDQLATQRMKRAAYEKLMSLSCDFHDNKKSDVTFQTVQRGARITDLVEILCFQLLPMAADLMISISVFWYIFDGYVGFVVGVVVVLYMWSTIKTLSLRSSLWREFIEVWEKEWYSMTESVKNWDAVSHFGRIPFEMNNFKEKTDDTRKMQIRWMILSKILGSCRNLILIGGLAAGACIVAHQVVVGYRDVGKFIVFTSYWAQLSTPLSFFAHGFNQISKGLVDAEKLLTLFEKTPTVQNAENAVPFVLKRAAVDFKNVSFSYDGNRKVTKEVTFHAEPGKIIAFVGETGCGKSTLFKLLFRFYDPKAGTINIDGQDISGVTLDSFREHIGIVPQEPALFNKTIRENLRYPDLDATDAEIEDACRAVSLHEKIISFTKGYDEIIGERGTKLSGGEKQRVAIARAILKNPDILLLDEATSSVDSTTEAQIQASLKTLCANRTTFVIAHRLSTIVNADQVVVMDDGKIVESGTHATLIKQNGPYKKLWKSQLSEHMSELRGRSRSRSKCRNENEHLLVNDLNSSDEEAKKLLAETVDCEGYTVTNDTTKSGKDAGSHEVSHDNQESRGREKSRSIKATSRPTLSAPIQSPKRPLLQRSLASSGATNYHSSNLFGVNSQNIDRNIACLSYSAARAAGKVDRERPGSDDDTCVRNLLRTSGPSASSTGKLPTEKTLRGMPNASYTLTGAYMEAYTGTEGAPSVGRPSQDYLSGEVAHTSTECDPASGGSDEVQEAGSISIEASRRRNESASEPTNQAASQFDGANEQKLSFGITNKPRGSRSRGNFDARRTVSATGVLGTPSGANQPISTISVEDVSPAINGNEGRKFRISNGRISGGLRSVASGAQISSQGDSVENDPTNRPETPLLKVPANSPAREATPSPGAKSDDGGMAMNGHIKKE